MAYFARFRGLKIEKLPRLWIAAAVVLMAVPRPASATVLVDTITGGGGTVGEALAGNQPLADSFTVGASPWTVTGLTFDVTLASADAYGFTVSLATATTDTSGQPAPNLLATTPLGTVSDSGLTPGGGIDTVFVTLTSPVVLSALTRYWIVLTTGSRHPSGASWAYQNTEAWAGLVNMANEYNYTNSGSVLNYLTAGPVFYTPYEMQVIGTTPDAPSSVSEPSSIVLMAASLLGIGVLARRRLH